MRGYDAPPKSAKRSTFSYKMGFCRRDKGVRFKKVHLLGAPHPPPPPHRSWLRAWKNHFFFGNPGVGALRCYGVHMNITRKTDH